MSFPPIMWAIFVLGLLFVAVRVWAGRAEERRRAAHEERMARLLDEREAGLQAEQGPHSLAALTSDASYGTHDAAPSSADPRTVAPLVTVETVKVRCRACKGLNDESATTCVQCGAEL